MENGPDRLEKGIRFACGGLLGAVIGFLFMIDLPSKSYGGFVTVCGLGAVISGALAVKYGDRFWYALKDWFRPG